MTGGYDPYKEEDFCPDYGSVVVNRLRSMMFPVLSDARLDQIIQQCRKGEFVVLKDLARRRNSYSTRFCELAVHNTPWEGVLFGTSEILLTLDGLWTFNMELVEENPSYLSYPSIPQYSISEYH